MAPSFNFISFPFLGVTALKTQRMTEEKTTVLRSQSLNFLLEHDRHEIVQHLDVLASWLSELGQAVYEQEN